MQSKNITVHDVAKHAGVSKSTVSLVLTESDKVSEKSKLKVRKSMAELGYVYNREAASLRSKRSDLVGIVIHDLTNPYAAQLAVGLEHHIRALGYMSVIVNSDENVDTQQQLVHKLKEFRLAALVICPAPGTNAMDINQLTQNNIPVIQIMRYVEGADAPVVIPDNINGTRLSTLHLLEQGIKHIAFIGGNDDISDYHERLNGFDLVVKEQKLDEKFVTRVQSDTNRQGGRRAIIEALELDPKLQGVVCFNDVIAYGAIEKLHALGKKPGVDIKLVGFDDLEDSAMMSPALSTVRIDAEKIGQAVCELLGSRGDDVARNGHIIVDIEFIARASG